MTNHRLSITEEDALTPAIDRAMVYFHIKSKTEFYAMTARHWLMANPIPDSAPDGQLDVSDLAGVAHRVGIGGVLLGVTDGWCKLMKRSRAEVIGQPLSNFLADKSKADHLANMNIKDIRKRPKTFIREFICGNDPTKTIRVLVELKRKLGEGNRLISVMSNLTVIEE